MHREKGKVHHEAKPYRLNVRRATDRWIGFHYTQNSEEKKKVCADIEALRMCYST